MVELSRLSDSEGLNQLRGSMGKRSLVLPTMGSATEKTS